MNLTIIKHIITININYYYITIINSILTTMVRILTPYDFSVTPRGWAQASPCTPRLCGAVGARRSPCTMPCASAIAGAVSQRPELDWAWENLNQQWVSP